MTTLRAPSIRRWSELFCFCFERWASRAELVGPIVILRGQDLHRPWWADDPAFQLCVEHAALPCLVASSGVLFHGPVWPASFFLVVRWCPPQRIPCTSNETSYSVAPRRRFRLGAVTPDTAWAAESLAPDRDRVPGPSPRLANEVT